MVKTKEINVYEFDELSDKIQEKVIQRFVEQEFEYMNLDFFEEFAKDYIEEKGFEDIEIQYSLSYSQGDGFSFEGTSSNNVKFLRENFGEKFVILATSYYVDDLVISVNRSSHQSVHSNSVYFDISINYISDDGSDYTAYDKEISKLSELVSELEDKGAYFLEDICKKLEKDGYSEIEQMTSEETIKENIEVNEYEFDIEGNLI